MNRTTRTALAALMLTAAPVVALAQGTSGTDMTTGGTGATTGATTGTTAGSTAGDMATGSTAGSTTGATTGTTDTMSGSANTGTTTTYGGSSATTGTAADSGATTGTMGATGSTASDTGASGSTSTASSGTGDTQVLAEVEKPSKGNARQRTAETQRALLNRFSQLGFADVREFRREGETYITEAKTAEGDWVSVVLDPESGTIVQRK